MSSSTPIKVPNPYKSLTFTPFTHIVSNLKTRVDVDLYALTFVVGPNRSYKTSIRQSIRLAAQRELTVENKKTPLSAPNKLLKFAADRTRGIAIELQSASGNLSYRLPINEETKKAKEAEPRKVSNDLAALTEEDWANAFPMDAVRQMLYFDARQTRQAIVRIFGVGVTVDPPMGLSDLQKSMWNEGLKTIDPDLDPVSALSALSSWAHDQKPKKTRAANSKEASLGALKSIALTSGVETLPDLEKRYAEAVAWERSAADRALLVKMQAQVANREGDLKESLASKKTFEIGYKEQERILERAAANDTAILQILHSKVADLTRRLSYGTSLLEDLSARIAAGKDECPFNHPVTSGHLQTDRSRIEARVKQRRTEFEVAALEQSHVEASCETSRTALERYRGESQRHLSELNRDITAHQSALEILHEGLTELKTRLEATPASYTGPASTELHTRIDNLKGAATARQQYEDGMRDVRRSHEESAACKVVETEAQDIMQRILIASKASAESRVNEFMPPEFRAELNLEDDECEWRVVGSDGEYHDSSASGSEFGSLIVALASALPGRLKILDMDDKDLHPFDPENIAGLWSAIEKAVKSGALTQAIIVHNRPDEMPLRERGWLILRQVRMNTVDISKVKNAVPPDPIEFVTPIEIAPSDKDLINSI